MVLEKIDKINIVSEKYTNEKSEEEQINIFLDAINVEKKRIIKLNDLFVELQNEMYATVNNEPSEIMENADYLQKIIDNTNIYINRVKTSLIFAGVETNLLKLVETIDLINEIKSDVFYRNVTSKNPINKEVNKKLSVFL